MHWHNDGREETRGTILVASSHGLFTDIVGEMVTGCGFTPMYPLSREAPWLALTGTQPCVVICDCAAPADGIQRLIMEVSARHIPLVLSDARMQQRVDDGSLILPPRAGWLTFPMSRDAFAAMLDALLSTPAEVVQRIVLETAPNRTPSDRDIPRRAVATALALGHTPRLSTAIRTYARRARANGEPVQDLVKDLMALVRDETPADSTLAKRSCDVAECAIEAYFEKPETMRVATWSTDAIRPLARASGLSRRSRRP